MLQSDCCRNLKKNIDKMKRLACDEQSSKTTWFLLENRSSGIGSTDLMNLESILTKVRFAVRYCDTVCWIKRSSGGKSK
jgi:hypothetical protein